MPLLKSRAIGVTSILERILSCVKEMARGQVHLTVSEKVLVLNVKYIYETDQRQVEIKDTVVAQ